MKYIFAILLALFISNAADGQGFNVTALLSRIGDSVTSCGFGKPLSPAVEGRTMAAMADSIKAAYDKAVSAVGPTVSTTDNELKVSSGDISMNKVVQSLTDGSTITWNIASGYNAAVTITGNRTLAISNPQAGDYGSIKIKQDATGSRTLALPSGSKVISGGNGSITLSTAANAVDILCFFYDGTNYYWSIGLNYN